MYKTEPLSVPVEGRSLDARFAEPAGALPGVLLVHGWDSDQGHYRDRAEDIAALRCVALTFDLQGHGRDDARSAQVSRADNLKDVLAAYDRLCAHPRVDPGAIALIGTSYGGYLAAIASALRPVRWLALRVPALYADAQWDTPKARLDRDEIAGYRRRVQPPEGNRALTACAAFGGDVLVVGSADDTVVPPATIRSYVQAFRTANSITHRSLPGADHLLSDERARRGYDSLLNSWLSEMLLASCAQSGR